MYGRGRTTPCSTPRTGPSGARRSPEEPKQILNPSGSGNRVGRSHVGRFTCTGCTVCRCKCTGCTTRKVPRALAQHTRAARERKCANTASANVVSVALKSTGGSASLLSRVTDVLGGTRKRSVTFSLRLSQAGMLSASMVFP